jgi:hypothetical protein
MIMMKTIIPAAAVMLAFALQGCGTYKVAAYADPAVDYERTCRITSGMEDVPDGDLEFRQFARWLGNALQAEGYRVEDRHSAALEIRLSYGMGEPRRTSKVSTDVWGKVSSSTSTSREMTMTIDAIHTDVQVWKIRVTCSSGDDLTDEIPIMIAAAQDYFGRSANLTVGISGSNPKIKVIKGE